MAKQKQQTANEAVNETNVNETAIAHEAINEQPQTDEATADEATDLEAEAENLPESEKLTELFNKQAEAAQAMAKAAINPRSKAYQQAAASMVALNNEIEAEKAAIRKAINDAKLAELRNERVKLATDLQQTAIAFATANDEAKAEAEAAMNTAFEIVVNELLAKYSGSRSAKATATTGEATNGQPKAGSTMDEIEKIAIETGKRHNDLQAMGYSRSTVWHALNNAVKAGRMEKNW